MIASLAHALQVQPQKTGLPNTNIKRFQLMTDRHDKKYPVHAGNHKEVVVEKP